VKVFPFRVSSRENFAVKYSPLKQGFAPAATAMRTEEAKKPEDNSEEEMEG
jgi:hypothetical protein